MNLSQRISSAAFAILVCLPFSTHAQEEPLEAPSVAVSESHIAPGSLTSFSHSSYIQVSSNRIFTGSLAIRNSEGLTMRSVPIPGTDDFSYVWDGTDEKGSIVPDGEYVVATTITDGIESRTDSSLTITVDTVAPAITLNGENPLHVSFGSPWNEPGATASDGPLEINGAVHTNSMATKTVQYWAVDKAGNRGEAVREIVIDPVRVSFTLANLSHVYDGYAKAATVQSKPNIKHLVSYNGSELLPVEKGSYDVLVVPNEIGYVGSTSGVLTISDTKEPLVQIVNKGIERTAATPAKEIVTKALSEVVTSVLDIEELQRALIRTGHLAIAAPTGFFGPLTQTAVRFYQLAHGLPQTGFVDLTTINSLQSETLMDESELMTKLESILDSVGELVAKVNGS